MSHAQIMRALEQSLHGGCYGGGLVGGRSLAKSRSMMGHGLVGGAGEGLARYRQFMAQAKAEGMTTPQARAAWRETNPPAPRVKRPYVPRSQRPGYVAPAPRVRVSDIRRNLRARAKQNEKCGPFGQMKKADLVRILNAYTEAE